MIVITVPPNQGVQRTGASVVAAIVASVDRVAELDGMSRLNRIKSPNIKGTMKLFCILALSLGITASSNFAAEAFVTVAGEVNTPGRQLHSEGLTVRTVIKKAGGFTLRASTKTIRFTPKGQKSMLLDRTEVESGKDWRLQPGDEVFVPRS